MKKLVISFIVTFLAVVAVGFCLNGNDKYYGMRQAYGSWYGTHEDHEGLSTAYFRLSENGTFEARFAKYKSTCQFSSKSAILGVWGLDQSVFFMITQKQKINGKLESVNQNKPGFYTAFKVLRLDEKQFIFARKKPWLSIPKFSKYSPFTAFRTKSELTNYFEKSIDRKWSDCLNITTLKELD